MSATETAPASLDRAQVIAAQRLAVAWQHPTNRHISPIGLLATDGTTYRFDYIQNVRDVHDFRPLPGFPDLHRQYVSQDLFPLFAQRVMDPRRDDYERYVEQLGLTVEATPWEQMSRSGGTRQGDVLQVFPEPRVSPEGVVACHFLVHGLRHVAGRAIRVGDREVTLTADEFEAILESLHPGAPLALQAEPTNDFNPRAVLTTTSRDLPLGWVPDLLLDDLYDMTSEHIEEAGVQVARVNGPDAPSHMRLLVELKATPKAGYAPFSGRRWLPMSAEDGGN